MIVVAFVPASHSHTNSERESKRETSSRKLRTSFYVARLMGIKVAAVGFIRVSFFLAQHSYGFKQGIMGEGSMSLT